MRDLNLVDEALDARAWTPRDLLSDTGLALLASWVAGGATMRDVAKRLDLPLSVLRKWRATYSELNRVLEEADDVAVAKVEAALMKRALGYAYEETTTETRDAPNGTTEISKTVTKQVLPDTQAATFWLKNRAPDRWAERARLDVNVLETEAQQILAVMDNALAHIGLTTAQRAALPDALAAAVRTLGLATEEVKTIER